MANERKSFLRKDVTGQKFGMLTALQWSRGGRWNCICECGNETEVDTRNLLSGHTTSCGCARKASKNVFDMTGYEDDNLRVIERSHNIGEIAAWVCECKHCGNVFVTKGANIRNGDTQSCGCVHSANEKAITSILRENGIEFETQYSFPDLKGSRGRALRFDFAIFNDGELKRLIEYNGQQHYVRPGGRWADQFDSLVANDKKKIEYCKQNNIDLKIISFKDNYTLNDLIN